MSLSKGQRIGSYCLIEDFRIGGGRSRISFAECGGQRWFVKEFLSPKYPTDDSPGSPSTKEYKRKQCEEFEDHQRKMMEVTRRACSAGSNLVCSKELIRVGASYYKITEAIDTRTISPEEVSKLSWKEIIIILRSLTSSLRILHTNQIVHGDLKPENILIKKTDAGVYTTKLIDFDDSYFSGQPSSDRESVVGTPEYYAPEVFAYISDEDERLSGETLTCKADIYTLGLIMCEYLTGQRPQFDAKKYAYAYAATMAGEKLVLPSAKYMTSELRTLMERMLDVESAKRPSVQEVFDALKKIDVSEKPTAAPSAAPTSETSSAAGATSVGTAGKPTLKIKMTAAGTYSGTAVETKGTSETKVTSAPKVDSEPVKPKLKGTMIR